MRLFSTPESCAAISTSSLPHSDQYRYCKGEEIHVDLAVGSLVWVMVSTRKSKGLTSRFFHRAHVQEMNLPDDRIRVVYPSLSTYNVRRERLHSVFTGSQTILVYPETLLYRHGCITHCFPNETFLEIGSDTGETCRRVKRFGDESRKVVGIDKSSVSVGIAKEQVPDCEFLCNDVFVDTAWKELVEPDVLAIDINGNRALQAVLECLTVALDQWSPRLVLVKSRTLYHGMDRDEEAAEEGP